MTIAFSQPPTETLALLAAEARQRILVLDGAMGTQIQDLGLSEEDYRGAGGVRVEQQNEPTQKGKN